MANPLLFAAAAFVMSCGGVVRAQATSRFAEPMPGAPSATAASLGLLRVDGDGCAVFYGGRKEGLARETARVLGEMHRSTRQLLGIPLVGYGVVFVDRRDALPASVRDAHWLNVDGIPSMVRDVPESALPLRDPMSAFLVFPLLIHESVDVGLKNAFFNGRLTEATVSSRWVIEGLADYSAYRAVQRYQEASFARPRGSYLTALRAKRGQPAMNLEDSSLWWPFPNAMPDDVPHAYAAAHYVVARLSLGGGDGWVRRALANLGAGSEFTSVDFCREATAATGMDARSLVRSVPVADVTEFAEGL